MNAPVHGVLAVNKPAAITSRAVVNRITRLVSRQKVGHAGTLDPLATGVLVVAVGNATRLIQYVQQLPKEYVAGFRLGCSSDTDDVSGNVMTHTDAAIPSVSAISASLATFEGAIEQVPPQFSAIRVGGQRAHRKARSGEAVELPPRTVQIHGIELLEASGADLRVRVECGSGTYIRAIARDVGTALGCGGLMTSLVRTRIGHFHLEDAVSLESIDERAQDGLERLLSPALAAVEHLPRLEVDSEQQRRIQNGRPVSAQLETSPGQTTTAIVSETGSLLAIAEYVPDKGVFAPRQVLS